LTCLIYLFLLPVIPALLSIRHSGTSFIRHSGLRRNDGDFAEVTVIVKDTEKDLPRCIGI